MDLKTRKTIVNRLSKEYKRARKKQRGVILDELIRLTTYNRTYARRIVRRPSNLKKHSRVKGSSYSGIFSKLRRLWAISHFACGQRLVPLIPVYLDSLTRHGEFKVTAFEKKLLLKISSATVDRLLREEKKKLNITGKGRSYTKPGSLLKHQIPIHTWRDWDNSKPGFLEIDTVHHNGGNPSGEYIHTLDTTDVATGWNECQALMGRGETGLVKALEKIKDNLPLPMLGIDFDSGGEFVNWHLVRYCKKNKLTYTRARESYSNDQPYIEQKNYSVV